MHEKKSLTAQNFCYNAGIFGTCPKISAVYSGDYAEKQYVNLPTEAESIAGNSIRGWAG